MIRERSLVDDFTTLDYQWRRPLEPMTKAKAEKMREVIQQVRALAMKHKVTVLLPNQRPPEDKDPVAFSLYREDWHNTIRFLPNIEQFRFPRSKKKRIRKKWALKPANWRRKKVNDLFFVSKARPVTEPSKRLCVPRDSDQVCVHMLDAVTHEVMPMRISNSIYRKITSSIVQGQVTSDSAGYNLDISRRADGKGFEVTTGDDIKA